MLREVSFMLFSAMAVLGLAIWGGFAMDEASCNRRAVSFEDRSYSVLGGCMVKHKGRWLPLDNIRGFDDN